MEETTQNRMNTMCDMINSLPEEGRARFFKSLEGKLVESEILALQVAASYRSLFKNPQKYEAMKKAVGENIYAELTK